MRGALSISGGREHPYLQKQRLEYSAKKNPNKQVLVILPSLLHFLQTLCPIIVLHDCLLFNPSIKILRCNCFLRSSFLTKAPCHIKLVCKKSGWFSFVNLSFCQFHIQIEPGTPTGSRKTGSFSTAIILTHDILLPPRHLLTPTDLWET